MNDILLVDKPASWTSFDVVAKLRGAIRAGYLARGEKPTKRQLKVGHAGTLDPFATGLLVILLGDACRKADTFLKLDKIYETTIELGKTSTTGDPEGELTVVGTEQPSLEEVMQAVQKFTGDISQTPPVFSAIKVNGERAYALARQGKSVTMPTRQVTVHCLEMLHYAYPYLTLRAHVSSGTYIRTLAEDIGASLGVGAYCVALRRLSIGSMSIDDAMSVETALRQVQLDCDEKQQSENK